MAGFLDYLLAGALLGLSIMVLKSKDLLVSLILFIIFGIFVALAWVQMNAPDVALVEAVIGSALTGALFLGSLAQIESRNTNNEPPRQPFKLIYIAIFSVLIGGNTIFLLNALMNISHSTGGLSSLILSVLPETGVKNAVTAVVLNIRGYDTLLEIGVLLITVVSVFALSAMQPLGNTFRQFQSSKVLMLFLDILIPIMVIVGFYLLWIGAYAPGGAFQAGAMLAGAGILMYIRDSGLCLSFHKGIVRALCSVGFLGFLAVGVYGIAVSEQFLFMPSAKAKAFIFIIELFATISITVILIVLFAGCTGLLNQSGIDSKEEGTNA